MIKDERKYLYYFSYSLLFGLLSGLANLSNEIFKALSMREV